MHPENANIRPIVRAVPPGQRLQQQIRTVLLLMIALTGVVAVTAVFFADAKAMLAALAGGLSQIVAVATYSRIARADRIPAPKAMLYQHLLAETAKIVVALVLLFAGVIGFGANAAWFIAAFLVTLMAYWLVLVLN